MANINWYKREKNNLNSYLKATIVLIIFIYSIELTMSQEYIPLTYNHFDSVPELYDEFGIKSIPWDEGVLCLGNGKGNNSADYSFSLIQYDLDGVKIWEKGYQFPTSNHIFAVDICSLNGNYLYVAGNIESDKTDRFLCKLNQNGDTIFFRKYIVEGHNRIIDIEKFSLDTLMILSIWKAENNSNYIKTVIDLVDTNGNIVKTTESSMDFKNPEDIILYNDLIYVGGTMRILPDSLPDSKVYISRYDLNLNYLGFTTPSLTERESFFSFTKTADYLLFTSRITMQNSPQYLYRTNISKINQQGALIDTNTFGPTDFAYYYAKTTNVGDEFIVTNLTEDLPKMYFHNLQLDLLCNYLIDIPYNSPAFAALEEITAYSTSMISGTGYIGYFVENEMNIKQWNFSTDDLSTFLYENCNLVSLNENIHKQFDYRIVPTISNKTITIECLSNDNFGITEIRVIDINGRLVLSKEFNERTSINIQNFSKGLHILYLNKGGYFETHKLLVY